MDAEHKDGLVAGFLDQNYYIISLRELGLMNIRKIFAAKWRLSTHIQTRDLIIFTRQMSVMLAAGIPILRCLEIGWEQSAHAALRQVVLIIKNDVEAGLALWEAVARHPQIFSGVYVSMLRAGEVGGVLDVVLERLSGYMEREEEIKSKVRAASLYPVMISTLALLVVLFIMSWVIPRFTALFESAGVSLPEPTRVLLAVGVYVKSSGLGWLLGMVIISCVLKYWGATPAGRLIYDNIYLHLPVVGKTVNKIAVARFARTLAILIKSGLPVVRALEVTRETVDNAVISQAVVRACNRIKEGEAIAAPFKETKLFEPMVTHMIAAGEETGQLEEMLGHLSAYYERELMQAVAYLTALIEPLLILLVAILIGSVVVATLLPIFDMMNLVGI